MSRNAFNLEKQNYVERRDIHSPCFLYSLNVVRRTAIYRLSCIHKHTATFPLTSFLSAESRKLSTSIYNKTL